MKRFKKHITMLLVMALFASSITVIRTTEVNAAAPSQYGYSDNKLWLYKIVDTKNKKVAIRPFDITCKEMTGDVKIPAKIKIGGTNYEVSEIGDWAFNTIYKAGYTAKQYWEFYTKKQGNKEINCFFCTDNSGLKSVTIPACVTDIYCSAFAYCVKLSTVTIEKGSKLQYIGESAFEDSGIRSITIPAGVTEIDDDAFATYDEDDKGVISRLTSITIEKGSKLKRIGMNAFYESSIKSITIPASVTEIDDEAFSYSSLTTVKIGKGSKLKRIGYSAFSDSGIKSITIPASVTEIEDYAFSDCESLTTVTIEKGSKLQFIGYGAFEYSKIKSITIPAGVTGIDDEAFGACSSLTTVTIEKGSKLNYIGRAAFSGSAIKSITIPKSVKEIDDFAFAYCFGLKTVEIEDASKIKENGVAVWCGSPVTTVKINGSDTDFSYVQYIALSIVSKKGYTEFKHYIDEVSAMLYLDNDYEYVNIDIDIFSKSTKVDIISNETGKQLGAEQILLGDSLSKKVNINDFKSLSKNNKKYRIVKGSAVKRVYAERTDSPDVCCCEDVAEKLTDPTYIITKGYPYVKVFVEEVKDYYAVKYPDYTVFEGLAASKIDKEGIKTDDFAYLIEKNQKVTFSQYPMCEKEGYKIDGYNILDKNNKLIKKYKAGTTASKLTEKTGEILNVALNYVPVNYEVSYNLLNGDETMAAHTNTKCTYDKSFKITNIIPEREGYIFKGWSLSSNNIPVYTAGQTVKDNLTTEDGETVKLYSCYEKITTKVSMVLNGGTMSGKTEYDVAYGDNLYSKVDLGNKIPVREGYKFTGWYLSSTGTKKIGSDYVVMSKTSFSIYAQWEKEEYTVTFDANGGDGDNITRKVFYKDQIGELPKPKRKGYVFLGWFTEKNDGSMVFPIKTIKGDTTLYAHWQEVTKKIWIKITVPKSSKSITGYEVTYGSNLREKKTCTYTSSQTCVEIPVTGAKIGEKFTITTKSYTEKNGKKIYSTTNTYVYTVV